MIGLHTAEEQVLQRLTLDHVLLTAQALPSLVLPTIHHAERIQMALTHAKATQQVHPLGEVILPELPLVAATLRVVRLQAVRAVPIPQAVVPPPAAVLVRLVLHTLVLPIRVAVVVQAVAQVVVQVLVVALVLVEALVVAEGNCQLFTRV